MNSGKLKLYPDKTEFIIAGIPEGHLYHGRGSTLTKKAFVAII